MRPYPKFQLLFGYPAVQQELDLTPAQKKQIERIRQAFASRASERKKAAEAVADQQEDEEAKRAGYNQARRNALLLMAEAEPEVLKVLDRKQRVRLEQIQLQASGSFAFLMPDVQTRLNMSPQQAELIQNIVIEGRNAALREMESSAAQKVHSDISGKIHSTPPGADGYRKINQKEMEAVQAAMEKDKIARVKMRRSINQEIARVLRKKQREAYQKMLGEPFIVDGVLVPKKDISETKAGKGESKIGERQ